MRIACWLLGPRDEGGGMYCVGGGGGGMRGQKRKVRSILLFILCEFFLQHNCRINRGIPVLDRGLPVDFSTPGNIPTLGELFILTCTKLIRPYMFPD
jgi:hypothetical protein